jgi:hypothetical protein
MKFSKDTGVLYDTHMMMGALRRTDAILAVLATFNATIGTT